MNRVKPKKHLGQHFLTDQEIAKRIVFSLENVKKYPVLEVGPGTGVLTNYLVEGKYKLLLSEVDFESIEYLLVNLPIKQEQFVGDFLKINLSEYSNEKINVIGNFPYNISSQIFFKILDFKDHVDECVGMLQKEVAERLSSKEGNKTYGILSVLLQVFYEVEYLFTVGRDVFNPPPKVESGVIRLKRNKRVELDVDFKHFKKVVKMAFSTRRKTLRNALKPLNLPEDIRQKEMLSKRAEQLSVDDFIQLAKLVK